MYWTYFCILTQTFHFMLHKGILNRSVFSTLSDILDGTSSVSREIKYFQGERVNIFLQNRFIKRYQYPKDICFFKPKSAAKNVDFEQVNTCQVGQDFSLACCNINFPFFMSLAKNENNQFEASECNSLKKLPWVD